jgi:D-alanyl-D-alanine-carboxypeptidase/D-alanyl-D-alanine-endopeptidase
MRMLFRNVVAVCGIALATNANLAAEKLNLQSRIDPLARPLIEDGIAVGIVIGVVQEGETQILAYGETVKGSGVAPDGDTIYEIGSASKVFTGVLLADMVQEGLVELDDPLQKFLPEGVQVKGIDSKPITLEHLATHTSGLPRLPNNFRPANPSNPYADYRVEQIYSFLDVVEPSGPPGKFEYSNFGMGLLGHILALRQDKTYEQLLIDRIARPLGMNDTRIGLDEEQRKRFAPPYDSALEPNHHWDLPTMAGAGGIRSSCRDLLTFLNACLADDDKPLSQALRRSHANRHSLEDGFAVGLGWHIGRDGAMPFHNGMTGGYHSYFAIVPERKVGVVVLSNTATMEITELGQRSMRVACGETVKLPPRRKLIQVDRSVLEGYAGYYAVTPQLGLTVTVKGDKLFVQATGRQTLQIFPKTKTEFFYKAMDAEITFVPDEEGKVNQLILHQNGRIAKGTRQQAP